ncbi:MAG: efflux RND transporter periplasmic adaptor subunit [Tepidisphaerales bacterium]
MKPHSSLKRQLLISLVFSGTALLAGAAAPEEPPPSVVVQATIEAFESSDQYAKDSGYILEVKADIGDRVAKGQVLAIIDDPELEKQVEAARALVLAKKELAKAAEAAVQQSRKMADVSRSLLALSQADLKLALVTLKRQEELFAAKAATDQQIDEVRTKAEGTRAQVAVGEAKVASAEADIRVAAANQAVAEAQTVVAEAEAQRLQTLQQYTRIVAPFDGVVTRRLVNRGDLVQAASASRTTPLFNVQSIDQVRIFCDVPESSAAAVTVGGRATVKVYGLGGQTIEGKVTRIATSLNPSTRTMRTEIDLPNPQEKLRPGMYAQVTLALQPPRVADAPAKP